MYGGFYHIQEDRSGNLWLKCRELPAYLMDGLRKLKDAIFVNQCIYFILVCCVVYFTNYYMDWLAVE